MRKRIRQHINPLKITALVPRAAELSLPVDGEVDVELGCGDARFIIELAKQHPERCFVGLDIREEFLGFGRETIAAAGLENIRLEVSNLIVDSDRLFSRERVSRFFINFPDPWFKLRQRRRRWLDEATVLHLIDALRPGGLVLYQSDVWSLAIEALGLLEGAARLENLAGEFCFLKASAFAAKSSRELSCEQDGLRIWRMLFRKR